jgi:hypothetical protein
LLNWDTIPHSQVLFSAFQCCVASGRSASGGRFVRLSSTMFSLPSYTLHSDVSVNYCDTCQLADQMGRPSCYSAVHPHAPSATLMMDWHKKDSPTPVCREFGPPMQATAVITQRQQGHSICHDQMFSFEARAQTEPGMSMHV